MSALKQALNVDMLDRLKKFVGHPQAVKHEKPVRVGILGAAQVATYAMIWPARRLQEIEVAAVAARDVTRAQKYARSHGIRKAYGSYEELIADAEVDVVYVALPNGLHGEWTRAALQAGKHVLCEKPFTANAQEAREVQAEAAERQLLCREAFHYKEHPVNQRVRQLLQLGVVGQMRHVHAEVLIPGWAFSSKDIRFDPTLAGGCMMDAGCYCAHALRFFSGGQPQVVHARPQQLIDEGMDVGMVADVAWPERGLTGSLRASLSSGLLPHTQVQVTGSRGKLTLNNFVVPFFGHNVRVESAEGFTVESFQVYDSGESNYYYQLQRFVQDVCALRGDTDAVKTAQQVLQVDAPEDARDCLENMVLVDDVYHAAQLPLRQPTRRRGDRGVVQPSRQPLGVPSVAAVGNLSG